jgi:predicted RNA-binding protein with PIN domain
MLRTAHYYQAYALFKTNKLDNARLQLIQALEKYPSWPDAEAGIICLPICF